MPDVTTEAEVQDATAMPDVTTEAEVQSGAGEAIASTAEDIKAEEDVEDIKAEEEVSKRKRWLSKQAELVETVPSSAEELQPHQENATDAAAINPISATARNVEVNEKPESIRQPTSRVHKNPQGWQEEGILFPHEGIRFLMQELSDAVNSMDPLPAWKWENLSMWYQDYFYSVVHHHHDVEEQLYLPWIQARVSVPTKIAADHPDLMQTMDDLSAMLKKGAAVPAEERAEHLADVHQVVRAFVEDMQQHLAEEEEAIPRLLREGGFTQEEEAVVVGKIIEGLGLDGNKKSLPSMLHAYALWAGTGKAEEFVSTHLPLPIQFLYRNFWAHDFQYRHMGLLASLDEGVDTNPFASKWFC